MKVTPIKVKPVVKGDKLFAILDTAITTLPEKSVVAIASKIIGICEGRLVKVESNEQKDVLAKQEAEFYLPREFNQYGFMITINQGILVASAGIDESNSDGYYSLWPENPQKSVNEIREYLCKRFNRIEVGVIMTDSRLSPLRWGVTGVAIAHSGFQAINTYIGKPDIFGRIMQAEKSNVADSLATSAVAEMGEGNEQQPVAIIEDIQFVHFQKRNPTTEEINSIKIAIGDDVFSSLLTRVDWKKGDKKN